MTRTTADERQADVIVVGAGPAGSTAAYHLARAGVDVLLLEKTAFPREKVCGDGLTPRAVRQLVGMGIDLDEAGWVKNHGLRIVGGGHRIELPWPDLAAFPAHGLVRTRLDFDEILARQAQKSGARLQERIAVTGPLHDERTGRVVGVAARPVDENGRASEEAGPPTTYRAPLVIAADGNSARLALAQGRHKRDDRPMGVAVRTYYRSPRHDDDWLESWLELWDGAPGDGQLLPGYGWIFGVGDGTANVGLGILNTSAAFGKVDYKEVLRRWLLNTPADWGFRDENMVGEIRGSALPMGFNRKPHYADGMLLVGDAGGMVNPFNGEGIAYAMESALIAADVVAQALARPEGEQRERALRAYPAALDQAYGGYYTLGRLFAHLIGHPGVMRYGTRYGLPRPLLMKFTLKMLANLTDPREGDAMDRVVNALSRIAPAA
ncbi:MAG TPA: geranylgeranyl reductase family protein [Nocardioidaceae bacterium]|jgi:geranylgeranyl reductase family protein|nr:geranylgeranyl reductase family protein [Actinomycetota bacterium]MDQ3423393.1 geranylgeranyl reductase family protein [Actinomycetota bacterium]HEV8056479.1 geranylgeranyl reductase family protein [Nocardioidaceae bacterium]